MLCFFCTVIARGPMLGAIPAVLTPKLACASAVVGPAHLEVVQFRLVAAYCSNAWTSFSIVVIHGSCSVKVYW